MKLSSETFLVFAFGVARFTTLSAISESCFSERKTVRFSLSSLIWEEIAKAASLMLEIALVIDFFVSESKMALFRRFSRIFEYRSMTETLFLIS